MTATATTTTPVEEKVVELPLDQLHESPFNPRRTFSEKGLDEMATDISAVGILQPLRVRPIVPPLFSSQFADGDQSVITGWEVVFGHRRRRAAIMAELPTAPCIVRVMTDAEARRAQISENLGREDVHPIEEAEGFQALMELDGLTADDIAEQTGKSRSYVYGRLKLLQACPRVRDACLAGKIGSEVALLVARVGSHKLQEKALAAIDKLYHSKLEDGGKSSFRAIRALLNEKFTLDIKKDAIFDPEDATLLPAAGRCSNCPKRTGNAPEFVDIANPDKSRDRYGMRNDYVRHDGPNVCTDPECFDAKKSAHLKRAAAAMASASVVVVTGNAARSAVSATGEVKGNYIAANKVKGVPKAGSGKAVIDKANGKPVPQLVKIQDPRTGKVHDAYKVADLVAAGVMKAADTVSSGNKRGGGGHNYEAERREREAKGQAETTRRTAQWHAMRAVALGRDRDAVDLTMIVQGCLELLDGHSWEMGELIAKTWGYREIEDLIENVPALSRDHKALLLLDMVTSRNVIVDGYEVERGCDARYLNQAMAHYGIDPEQAAASASTPSTAGAGADDAAAGAGAHSVATDGCAGDELDVDEEVEQSQDGAAGSGSSQTRPAGAGGGRREVEPVGAWSFPKQAY